MRELADGSIDSCVTDPPYHLTAGKKGGSGPASVNTASPAGRARVTTGFMGMKWDGGDVAHDPAVWAEVFRVLKPGGHVLAFAGTRTYHRLASAIEAAGFEIRDMGAWLYGSGFPKSLNVSKAIDKAAGAERQVVGPGRWNHVKGDNERQSEVLIRPGGKHDETAPATDEAARWAGWGTALKPAMEPICIARKPLEGTVAANVLAHGTGALNIDACRIGVEDREAYEANCAGDRGHADNRTRVMGKSKPGDEGYSMTAGSASQVGRWPANVLHDGSDEVVSAFPDAPGQQAGLTGDEPTTNGFSGAVGYGGFRGRQASGEPRDDSGSAARFFYSPKASRSDRNVGCEDLPARDLNWSSGTQSPGTFQSEGTNRSAKNFHPTVKPTDVMRWLVRLVTPPGGTVLDPFAGSGSTGRAADIEQFEAILIEIDPAYCEIIRRRIAGDLPLFAAGAVTS